MKYLYEFYYVFINSYRIKIKKPGLSIPVYFICISDAYPCLLGVHGDQEFFI
jgi:hypothetical protein